MQKFTKVVAFIMLSISVFCVVGCGDNNNGVSSESGNSKKKSKSEKNVPKPENNDKKADNDKPGNMLTLNGHEYVDLDLPSGTLWATCNVGTVSPEGYGEYFCWGETQPKSYYGYSNYKYWKGERGKLTCDITKYCNDGREGDNGYYDNLTTLEANDDAAVVNWGGAWRMPTRAEMEELIDYTTHTMTTFKDVPGVLFTGSNGKTLFFPAAGHKYDDKLVNTGVYGNYWSSSIGTYGSWGGSYFIFDVDDVNFGVGNSYRNCGHSVRPVCSKNDL